MKKYFTPVFKRTFENISVDVFKHLFIKYPEFINCGKSILLAETIFDSKYYDFLSIMHKITFQLLI